MTMAVAFGGGPRAVAAEVNAAAAPPQLQEIVVSAERLKLIGTATTASEGVVVNEELALTPVFRPGQLLETVPGLDVTSHSGEGKANQYLMRGYNLDHGTNLALYVDEMPINEPTNAHGQGYADLNFMIPELATDLHYSKGTYYAKEGDFASVGAIHVSYLDSIDDQISLTAGTLGFQRVFSGGSVDWHSGRLLGAVELQHYDGPWVNPDDQRKANAVIRYSDGDGHDGYSLTAMYYHGLWNSTTDQPNRAITDGLITRFGSLSPSDGGMAQRASLSGQLNSRVLDGRLAANAYIISNQLTLWNDFTHFLVDPINGDQEAQHEDRVTFGGGTNYTREGNLFAARNETSVGMWSRFDVNDVHRLPTVDRVSLPVVTDPLNFSERDHVRLGHVAAYAQATTYWQHWLRTVLAMREDFIDGIDTGTNPGSAHASLFQPKASLIFTATDMAEFYFSAGRGFHSDDLRGVNQAAITGIAGAPLIAKQDGEEIGMRLQGGSDLSMTFAYFLLDAQSETTYGPDVGQDVAGPASRRRGFELNVTYQVFSWLELYGSYSADHARFKTPYDDGTGHVGEYLPNAPFATGSFALYVNDLGPWSGGLQYRYLGAFPLSSDNAVKGSGYAEWNGNVRYSLTDGWSVGLGIYNITNKKADAMEYWYVDRLPGEAGGGRADVHMHPLEPISVRLTLSKKIP